jgi:hypothetical protein
MSEGSPGSCTVAAESVATAGTAIDIPVRPAPAPRTASPGGPAPQSPAGPAPRFTARLGSFLFFALVALVLYAGWSVREEEYLTAESGLGYALGITGAVMMLLLGLYPLRKRARFMRNLGAVRHWFRAHMIKGVLGPVCILFHANFQTGSLNSNVALFTMLVVVTSGLLGRFVYTKVHYGLYGGKATLSSLRRETEETQGALWTHFPFCPELRGRLEAIEARALAPRYGLLGRLAVLLTARAGLWWERVRLVRFMNRALAAHAAEAGWSRGERRRHKRVARRYLRDYLKAVRRVTQFSFYEPVFGVWHLLHFPLFLMLIVAGIVHVFAVHMY